MWYVNMSWFVCIGNIVLFGVVDIGLEINVDEIYMWCVYFILKKVYLILVMVEIEV